MICLEAQYFNLNKILLQGIALWPFQQSKFVRFQFIINLTILITAIVGQINTFVTTKFTPKFALKVFSCVLFLTVLVVHYSAFGFNIKILKDLLRQLHYTCTKLRDENEIAIIQKYGWNAQRYTTVLSVFFFGGVFAIIVSQIAIVVLDIISPKNGSRSPPIQIAVEYFIDEQKYYYLILFHVYIAFFIGILQFLAIGTLLLTYVQHTCGMFKIVCYRIEHAMDINVLKNISLKNESSISEKIIYAVNIHRKAMKLSELILSKFDTTYFCLTVLTVITLSLNFFQIFQNIISDDNIVKVSVPTIIVLTLTLYMFLANLCGQNVMDHNNEVYATAYNIQWYMCSLRVQRLIMLLLQRRAKECYLICGGLFIASFECFASQVKATMSYFTLIHSTR